MNIEEIVNSLKESERVLIGAGAGMSAAIGIDYTDTEKFSKVFPKMVEKGYKMQYELLNYEGRSEAEKCAYWATHVNYIRYEFPVSSVYKKLLKVVKDLTYGQLITK